MSKLKLLVSVTLCAVIALPITRAAEPQDESDPGEPPVGVGVVQKLADVDVVVLLTDRQPGPKFENVGRNATPENRWLREMLSKPVPPLDFPGENPLSKILDTISTYCTNKFGTHADPGGGDFRMTFYPDLAELNLEGITSLEDVIVRDINFEGQALQNALQLIFDQTTDPELTYLIENQVMKVTTRAKAESEDNLYTRVYNVGDLADLKFRTSALSDRQRHAGMTDGANAAPTKGGVGLFSVPAQFSSGKSTPVEAAAPDVVAERTTVAKFSALESLLMEMTTPPAKWTAIDGEGGSIRLVGHTLFVRQTHTIQEMIVATLNTLDADSAYHTRIYKVGELANLQFSADDFSQDRQSSGEPLPATIEKSNLETLIVEMTSGEWSGVDGEGGAIRKVDTNFVIRQTAAVHTQIVDLLELLSKMKTRAGRGAPDPAH